MKKALIDPTTAVSKVTGWSAPVPPQTYYTPITELIPSSARVAEVTNTEFPITPPLFWADCADNVVADEWYYDTATTQILVVPAPAPYPGTEGATTGVQAV